MKIFPLICFQWAGVTPCEEDSEENIIDPFLCEAIAYQRLKATGFCERREVPDFYGTITNIQLSRWPHLTKSMEYTTLDRFYEEENLPSAILIEYIPDCEKINLSNYSPQYAQELRRILTAIHLAGILHDDPYPRNMMISKEQNRAFWIDFDRAQTYDGTLSKRQKGWFQVEEGIADEFFKALVSSNQKSGVVTLANNTSDQGS